MLFVSGCSSNEPADQTGGGGEEAVTPAEGATPAGTPAENGENDESIVEAADAAGFTTFVAVVKDAGLESTLNEGGPYTVFAPTNEAFDKLPAGTLDNLKNNKELVNNVLTYHVVSGEYRAANLADGSNPVLTTLEGGTLPVNVTEDGNITVGTATVVTSNIAADNGVIHGIDEVLIPPNITIP
jgi:uncharacterized surface protein with fasciclin (FAS1) repeats